VRNKMSNASSIDYTDVTANYLGVLFVIGANQTPFLTMMGGLRGYKPAPGFEYAMEQYAALETAAQRTVTEASAVAGSGTPKTYVKAQRTNTAQIMYYPIEVSYAKASERLKLAGVAYATPMEVMEDERDFQTRMTMMQLAVDIEYSCLQGTYVTKSAYNVNSTTRGIIEATTAGDCKINAGSGYTSNALSKAMVDDLSKKLADFGAPMTTPAIFVGSFQMQKLSNLYGWAPVGGAGAGLGGVRVERIITQFFEADVVFSPQMPASALLIADMDKCQLRGVEMPGKGAVFVEPKGKVGASDAFQLYAQLGLDYGDPNFHGVIYGLATS
jgi:hypothetical protein